MGSYKKIILLTFSTMLLGCFGGASSVPVDRFYTLEFSKPGIVKSKYQRININKVRAYGIYNERAMLYSNAKFPLQIKRYHYHHWVMLPTQLIQQGLKEFLVNSQISREVATNQISKKNTLEINVDLLAFERVIDNGEYSVRTKLVFNVFNSKGESRSYNYNKSIKVKRDTLHDTAKSYGKILSDIFNDFLKELALS